MHDPLLNCLLGDRYHLTGVVGRGGMGVVYRAEDLRLANRSCAVKLLTGGSMDPAEAIRFERELRIIARLHSPHVVRVLDTGSLPDQRRYIVMELLEGLPLSEVIKQGPLSPDRAVNIAKGILAGLAEAHEHGVVHRDLKPGNVFIIRARTGMEIAKVLDFGIAKESGGAPGEADLTSASMLIGTPKYMAPEQFLKQPADARTDLYALGLLFYQMLAGRPPFLGKDDVPDSLTRMPTEFRVGWLHVNRAPVPLDLPPGLWSIIDRLLSKEPDDRFADAITVIDALVELAPPNTMMLSTDTALNALPPPRPAEMPAEVPASPSDEVSSTTGFPITGEDLSATPPKREGRMALYGAAAAALLFASIGITVVTVTSRASEDSVATSAPAGQRAGRGRCVDHITSTPAGATVFLGIGQAAQALGSTPLDHERGCADVIKIRVEKQGYETKALTLRGRDPRNEAKVVLTAKPKPVAKPVAPPEPIAPPIEKPKPKVKKAATRRRAPSKARTQSRPSPAVKRPARPVRRTKPKPRPSPSTPSAGGDEDLFF